MLPAGGNLMHGPCRSWRTRARTSGQCRRLSDAAPNPGSQDTSYGLAGAPAVIRPLPACEQENEKRGRVWPNFRDATRVLHYNKTTKILGPCPAARPRCEARGQVPSSPSHPLDGGGGQALINVAFEKERKRERQRERRLCDRVLSMSSLPNGRSALMPTPSCQ